MSTELVTTLMVVGGGIVVQLLINRSNRRGQQGTEAIAGKTFDLQALGKTVETLQTEVQRLDGDLGEERDARRAAEQRADEERAARRRAEREAENAKREATRAMRKLTRRVAQLEQVLRDNDMTVPAALADVDL